MLDDFAGLLARARDGDADAIAVIYRAFHPPLFRFLRFEEPVEAEDLAADVWMTVARSLSDFEGDERGFLSWTFTIARRRVIDTRRKRARRQTASVAAFDDAIAGVAGASEAAEVIGGEWLRSALDALSPAQAEVVTLRVVCDLAVEDVAQLVGRTPEAVRALQHRALRRLAAMLGSRQAVTR